MNRAATLLLVIATAFVGGCGGTDEPGYEVLGMTEVSPGVLEIESGCSPRVPVDVDVVETTVSVTIEVSGEWSEALCVALSTVRLGTPLGDRALIVNGERWGQVSGDCPWGELGPDWIDDRTDGRCQQSDT